MGQADKLEERLPQRSEAMVRAIRDAPRQQTEVTDADGDVVMDVKQEPMEHNDRSCKKRRMEKLLATDQLATLRVQAEETVESAERTKRGGRKSSTPRRSRFWIPRGDDRKLQGPKFELSWCHWFYSYIDVDFFRHNEFVQCLDYGSGTTNLVVCEGFDGSFTTA
ncbi:Hypothetical protein PHPALM_38051 [Phytophthora palmivora]|uniref:Uncharacterized protein n=1 Tax=Phytophthora palmivora TaxID=4796 RepID=A0A2P4WVX0_9STRA|nr:Hypothetical protein PHPALM_38051 [Phytophthora palmivora]